MNRSNLDSNPAPEEFSEEAFAEAYQLRRSKVTPCFARLVGKRCTRLQPSAHHELCRLSHRSNALDHAWLWNRDGETVLLVSQPYDLSTEGLADLARLEEFGLYVWVTTHSWYAPGAALLIQVWRSSADAHAWPFDADATAWERRTTRRMLRKVRR